eukprot:m.38366 g.38366  ORF g.38366 m.38366 type:complete len:665 (-) comp6794_c0_seq1:106-2100(-)
MDDVVTPFQSQATACSNTLHIIPEKMVTNGENRPMFCQTTTPSSGEEAHRWQIASPMKIKYMAPMPYEAAVEEVERIANECTRCERLIIESSRKLPITPGVPYNGRSDVSVDFSTKYTLEHHFEFLCSIINYRPLLEKLFAAYISLHSLRMMPIEFAIYPPLRPKERHTICKLRCHTRVELKDKIRRYRQRKTKGQQRFALKSTDLQIQRIHEVFHNLTIRKAPAEKRGIKQYPELEPSASDSSNMTSFPTKLVTPQPLPHDLFMQQLGMMNKNVGSNGGIPSSTTTNQASHLSSGKGKGEKKSNPSKGKKVHSTQQQGERKLANSRGKNEKEGVKRERHGGSGTGSNHHQATPSSPTSSLSSFTSSPSSASSHARLEKTGEIGGDDYFTKRSHAMAPMLGLRNETANPHHFSNGTARLYSHYYHPNRNSMMYNFPPFGMYSHPEMNMMHPFPPVEQYHVMHRNHLLQTSSPQPESGATQCMPYLFHPSTTAAFPFVFPYLQSPKLGAHDIDMFNIPIPHIVNTSTNEGKNAFTIIHQPQEGSPSIIANAPSTFEEMPKESKLEPTFRGTCVNAVGDIKNVRDDEDKDGNPFPKKSKMSMQSWSNDQVLEWLDEKNLSYAKGKFKDMSLTGLRIPHLTKGMLQSMGFSLSQAEDIILNVQHCCD